MEKNSTFEYVCWKKRRVKLKRPIAVLNHMLMQFQLTVAEGSIAGNEKQISRKISSRQPIESIRSSNLNSSNEAEGGREGGRYSEIPDILNGG